MILGPEGLHCQRAMDILKGEGVLADRISFVAPRLRPQYLELYRQIDIGLDTFPYNGHTTSLDSFWMGVPVVTLVGSTVVGRAGSSQLTNLGLTELIAKTPDEFISIASELATHLPCLTTLRATLRERMRSSPLMDAPRFARNIEKAYREIWEKWCNKNERSRFHFSRE
jgi:predicted O-linked N-acetylglucosamine transferase (SPINDLY family)